MKRIYVTDMTLVKSADSLSFKEKIEIARYLDKLHVDVIDMPEIKNVTTDSLLVRTVSALAANSTVSVSAGMTAESIEIAAAAIASAKKGRLKVCLPVSAACMEYLCHKKPNKMLELAGELFAAAVSKCADVEFFAIDATRAETSFLKSIIELAVDSGIKTVTLCDDEGEMLPDEFAEYVSSVKEAIPALSGVRLGVLCKSNGGMAAASALMAIKAGADEVRTSVGCDDVPQLAILASVLSRGGDRLGMTTEMSYTVLQRITKQIEWILGVSKKEGMSMPLGIADGEDIPLDAADSREVIVEAVKRLGYDLSEDDYTKVYEEFVRVAERKTVGSKELEAIVASVALQVSPTYKLVSYVINNGNIISASAQITLEKNGEQISGICTGDGPVDASFRALEQIIGHHFELDDFQIQSITEGREAMGSALVRLRHDGKLYSGNGISTDIIGSSIRAYIGAVNKIVYEEE